MKRRTLSQSIDQARSATSNAFNQTATMAGVSNDPDVRLYERLSQDDLMQLSQKYGLNQMIEYIRTMESKRMGRR